MEGSGASSRKRRSAARYTKFLARRKRDISTRSGTGDLKSLKLQQIRKKRFSDEDGDLDISRLGDKAAKYSPLFNNSTRTDNSTSGLPSTEIDSSEAVPYEAAIVYGKTELTLTNLKHFQEYSIEVCQKCGICIIFMMKFWSINT
jgi:hypothetical protein